MSQSKQLSSELLPYEGRICNGWFLVADRWSSGRAGTGGDTGCGIWNRRSHGKSGGGGLAGTGGVQWRWEGWNRWCTVEVGRLEPVVLILGMERERERKGAGRGRV
uniref:Uncharacterized protein n=1 Tax=Fagus sylvatica TaxID=28930 RepID=A0A2N9J985_FAGSY